jgi:hypothetical protein
LLECPRFLKKRSDITEDEPRDVGQIEIAGF